MEGWDRRVIAMVVYLMLVFVGYCLGDGYEFFGGYGELWGDRYVWKDLLMIEWFLVEIKLKELIE